MDAINSRIVPSDMYGHKAFRDRASHDVWLSRDRDLNIRSAPARVDPASQTEIHELVELARPARVIVAFTGAGISTESGIPDYRGPGGVWERNAPPTLSDFRENEETRRRYWVERRERYGELRGKAPNAGHFALARLQAAGIFSTNITQNIDGLH